MQDKKLSSIFAPSKGTKELLTIKTYINMNERFFTYAKYDGLNKFTAFDINEGYPVTRKIYCTLIEATDDNKRKLQELADLNKEIKLKIQLRDGNNKVVFETK